MQTLEKLIIDLLLLVTDHATLFDALTDSRTVAIIVGALVATSGALLGTFLLLRKMALTSDAISHTVLLGIVVTFLILTKGLQHEPDLNSPWLIIGAAVAGVITVYLTELTFQSGLVKEDAALGLIFSFLFAVAVILINQTVENVHLDQDSIWAGEIGLAFGKTNEYCYENCDTVTITADSPHAETGFQCTNCGEAPAPRTCRDQGAVCEEYCYNCGTYSAAEAYIQKFTDQKPVLVLFPKAISAMGLITLLNVLFVTLLYKELKLATFDAGLATSLGFHPQWVHYLLMTMVSITAVGAFESVGAILVVGFFIVPAATAYLLTDRLWVMLVLSSLFGALAAYTGYDLSRGAFLGIEGSGTAFLELLDSTVGLGGYTDWDTSPSASMVMMMGFFFTVAWIVSPRYGLVVNSGRRFLQRQRFAEQLVLIHLAHHQATVVAETECNLQSLPEHFNWSPRRTQNTVQRLRLRQWIKLEGDFITLTPHGQAQVEAFYATRH